MNELRYQLDLMRAMNQKLSAKERMYRLLCDTMDYAYIYYSFEKNTVTTLGKWDDFFDFQILDRRDFVKLQEMVDEPYVLALREMLFLEKSGRETDSVECMQRGKKTWLQFSSRIFYEDGRPTDQIIVVQNITKQKTQNEELLYMAYYDSLTGLYNRNYFVRLLTEFLRRAKEDNRLVSVLVIDIDDFRKVNDGLGIVAGDELVQQFGSFLKEFNGDDVIVCHLTSDVYCMAIYDPCGNKSVEHIHKKIVKRTREPFYLVGGQVLNITVSVGVAEYPEAATSALELINCAEIVMFKGKAMGKNRIQYFDTPILNDFLKNVELDSKLKEAVFENNFLLYYQPQYYAGNRKLRGVEALIRWKDGNGRMISPAKFIPIAEKNGTIIPIGNWVLEQSIRTFSEWRNRYGVPFVLSVNISALQYQKEDFVETLLNIIHKYDVDPDEIELEITESILIDDFSAVTEKMQLLKEYGIRISLDDFGTGFSSLSYLKKLPINTLKIDKSFTDTLLTDSATRIITESIVSMVKSLGFESIAEGVEEEQQYKYLRAVGCDIIQGYLFGKPLSPGRDRTTVAEDVLICWVRKKEAAMLTGREQETAFLENHYKRTGSQILVVYGQRGVGKTALLTSFTEKKQTLRYSAGNCSSREQQYLWGRELRSRGKEIAEYPSWRELLECMTIQKGETTADKKVLIIENFQYLLKGDTLFLQELIRFLKEKKEALLVILTTYASGWVENSMISKVGNLAFSVSGFLKVKELPFSAMRKIFSDYTVQESISLYATLGGLPGLWRLLYPQNSAEENLIRLLLQRNSFLPELMIKWLSEELRETAVYDTILATLADGRHGKLNDMYAHTGFSRAKISVYLKNLMELELVEKVLPGTYEICNAFVRFYFCFLFPHQTSERTEGSTFYEKYIREEYNDFQLLTYRRICQEVLQGRFRTVELWNSRQGKIYFLCREDTGRKIVVDYSGTVCYTSKDYDVLQASMKREHVTADSILIFSENGYEKTLTEGTVQILVHSVDENS